MNLGVALPTEGRGLESAAYYIDTYCISRPPHGGRGLKYASPATLSRLQSPPHGGRGLKYVSRLTSPPHTRVALPTGAWIEIDIAYRRRSSTPVALPTEGVD